MSRRLLLATVVVLSARFAAAQAPAPRKPPTFERDVRPLLTARCIKCHGAEKPRAKLDLRDKAGMLTGGQSGPALVPGAADKSLLFDMLKSGEMPPEKNPKLEPAEVALIKAWIDAGAPVEKAAVRDVTPSRPIAEKDRRFWSFQKPVRPPVPRVQHVERVRTPIDAFILAKLESVSLTLSPEAGRETLMRRLSLDLTGLPPDAKEVADFVADTRPEAYERLVDRLLALPRYGERWGRHWLDVAGYADTLGPDNDAAIIMPREGMWRYRDYVVRSLNEDKPYDRFLFEQLAGDEMDDWRNAPALTPAMREHLVATGFLRTATDNTFAMELNRPLERFQVLHDTIDTLTSAVLGLTVHCAQCHDHKFDPIPQVDYYRLMACLTPSYNLEHWIPANERHLPDVSPRELEALNRANAANAARVEQLGGKVAELRRPVENRLVEARMAAIPEALRADLKSALASKPASRSEVQKYLADKLGPLVKVSPADVDKALTPAERAGIAELTRQIAVLNAGKRTTGQIQALWEPGGKPPSTHLLRRGNFLTPGAEVQPGVLSVLAEPGASPVIAPTRPNQGELASSGRRTALARWLTRPDHPLTARVQVNRAWRHFFGEALVATVDNFGRLGGRPTHPELLDWLATEFVRGHWSMKSLHRLIVTSSAYRQASIAEAGVAARAATIDPGNQLLWRMRLRRVESEVVRDAVLAVSGRLDLAMGGPPVLIDTRSDGSVVINSKGLSSATAPNRRSLYLLARRNYNLSLLNVFDQPVMGTNCTRRISSAVPLQSLALLNDAFMLEQADAFASRIAVRCTAPQERIELAFRLAYARRPNRDELTASLQFLHQVAQRFAQQKLSPAEIDAKSLARLCHMLLCGNEFLYVG